MQNRELYQQILGLKSPWSVSEVSPDLKLQQVDVFVEPQRQKTVRRESRRFPVGVIPTP